MFSQRISSWKSLDRSNFLSTMPAASPPLILAVDQTPKSLITTTRGWILVKHLVLTVASIRQTWFRPAATLPLFVRLPAAMKRSTWHPIHTAIHATLIVQTRSSSSFVAVVRVLDRCSRFEGQFAWQVVLLAKILESDIPLSGSPLLI